MPEATTTVRQVSHRGRVQAGAALHFPAKTSRAEPPRPIQAEGAKAGGHPCRVAGIRGVFAVESSGERRAVMEAAAFRERAWTARAGGRFRSHVRVGGSVRWFRGGVPVSTGWHEVQIACRGWSAGHVKSRPCFNCRSSVRSGCLTKQPRAMAPAGRASQAVAKSGSPRSTAWYGRG
jgi:hypothetical protein